jgi:hypothetical protein
MYHVYLWFLLILPRVTVSTQFYVPNTQVEWEESWWESSDWSGMREMGAEKSGCAADGVRLVFLRLHLGVLLLRGVSSLPYPSPRAVDMTLLMLLLS